MASCFNSIFNCFTIFRTVAERSPSISTMSDFSALPCQYPSAVYAVKARMCWLIIRSAFARSSFFVALLQPMYSLCIIYLTMNCSVHDYAHVLRNNCFTEAFRIKTWIVGHKLPGEDTEYGILFTLG